MGVIGGALGIQPDRFEGHGREEHAWNLRREVHVLPRVARGVDSTEPRADLQKATFPRFLPDDLVASSSITEFRIASGVTGTNLDFCRSARGVPFARLRSSQTNAILAQWPLFPVIGAANGPGFLRINGWNIEIRGKQGRLDITFSRHHDGSLRSYLTRAADLLRLRGEPHPTVSVRCTQRRDHEFQFSFQNSAHWRAA